MHRPGSIRWKSAFKLKGAGQVACDGISVGHIDRGYKIGVDFGARECFFELLEVVVVLAVMGMKSSIYADLYSGPFLHEPVKQLQITSHN